MTDTLRELQKAPGECGIDGGAPAIVALIAKGAGGAVLVGAAVYYARMGLYVVALLAAVLGFGLLQIVQAYLYFTRRGKFVLWSELLASLALRGDKHVLDMGCGRGAVLALAAKLIPRGRAVGVDLWRARDQSGNSLEAARKNLETEGVGRRCELQTADMRALPFSDAAFDLVVSSLAIHNIASSQGRIRAIDEAMRVLEPGGRLLIVDLMRTHEYAKRLRERGMTDVTDRRLDWRFSLPTLGMAGLVTSVKAR